MIANWTPAISTIKATVAISANSTIACPRRQPRIDRVDPARHLLELAAGAALELERVELATQRLQVDLHALDHRLGVRGLLA